MTLLSILTVIHINVFSQQLYVPRNIQKAYSSETRSHDGKPGKNYWQNSADYTIDVSFDPEKRLVWGKAEIEYFNNSPDSLNGIIFKLAPNLYKKDAMRLVDVAAEDESDGVTISKLQIGDSIYDVKKLKPEGTLLPVRINLLPAKSSKKISVEFSYTLNKGSHYRTGEIDDGSYFIAYFFPRIAAYDDIKGWDANPYTGNFEFYNDFGNFNVNISVPAHYVVWATGDLKNPAGVLNEKFVQRIRNAEQSDKIIDVIDSNDVKERKITTKNKINTWTFNATNVTDFAFALSNHYCWKSVSVVVDKSSGRKTRVDAVFNQKHKDYFPVIDFAKRTVEVMSYDFPKWPFPFPHITVFDGLDQMEYPMMVNDNPVSDRVENITLTDHEIMHSMFPFYMGINETKYGWMDEGWATIGEWLISNYIDSAIVDDYGMFRYTLASGKEIDLPIMTLTTQMQDETAFINDYPKPALGYLYVKEMLGDSLFFKALHYYIANWNGKHPMPYDFFNCMNTGSGIDLNWFWKNWFFDSGYADLSVDSVVKTKEGYEMNISNKGTKVVPIELHLEFSDGSHQSIKKSIAAWKNELSVKIPLITSKQLNSVILRGVYIPDVNPTNNLFMLNK